VETMGKTTSKTTERHSVIETLVGIKNQGYTTTITDGDRKVKGSGKTSEKSQEKASKKWDK
jgi:hypothetical protein